VRHAGGTVGRVGRQREETAEVQPQQQKRSAGTAQFEAKQLALPGFELQTKAMVITGQPSFDEWKKAGGAMQQVDGALHWWIGDWLRYAANEAGEGNSDYELHEEAAKEMGYSEVTLQQDHRLADAYSEPYRRLYDVSWSHYRVAAAIDEMNQTLPCRLCRSSQSTASRMH